MGGRQDRPRRRSILRALMRLMLLAALALTAVTIVGFWGTVLVLERRLPDVFSFEEYRRSAKQVTRVLAADGSLLDEVFEERRTVVDIQHLPPHVLAAIVAAEDAEFFSHPGIDLVGIARAMLVNLRAGRVRQGGSTITQQVAKTFFLSPERTLARKLEELVLARKLEQRLSKEEILALYLNQIYFGHGRWGIEEAARFYFGRPARDLLPQQAATLAGLIRSPENLSPVKHPKASRQRRDHVLRQMAEADAIPEEDLDRLLRSPLGVRRGRSPTLGLGRYFTAEVERQVRERLGRQRVSRGGLTIHTTLDSRLQRAAEAAVADGLATVDARLHFDRPARHIPRRRIAAEGRERVRGEPVPAGRVTEGLVVRVERAERRYRVAVRGGECCLAFEEEDRFRSAGVGASPRYHVGDIIYVARRHGRAFITPGGCPRLNLAQGPEAALVALDVATREVRALVGGTDGVTRPFDRALHARRQAGSTFKPIVYAAALEGGVVTPETELENRLVTYRGAGGRPWTPRNFDGREDGEAVTVREALARSLNVVAVQVERRVGVDATVEMAHRLGLTGAMPRDLTIALGSAAVRPIELTNVYATIADSGRFLRPVFITRVIDAAGRELLRDDPAQGLPVLAPRLARELHDMLVAVVEEGTGRHARIDGVRVAGKTGTANDGVDTWFVGDAAGLVTGVWVGFDDARPLKGTGGSVAAPLWRRFMLAAVERSRRDASGGL